MTSLHSHVRPTALRVAAIYLLLGGLWIFFSDRLVASLALDTTAITVLQTYKGWFYVVLTAALAFVLWSRFHIKLLNATENLRQEEESKSIMLQSIGDAVIATDKDQRIVLLNPEATRLTGWPSAEAIGQPLTDVFRIVSGKTRQPAANPADKVLRSGKVVGLANHTILLSRNGQEFQIADSGAPLRDSYGEIRGVILVFRDVTSQYAMQEALSRSEERLRLSLQAVSEGVWEMDAETGQTRWSERFFEIVGRSAADGEACADVLSEHLNHEDHTRLQKQLARLRVNPGGTIEMRLPVTPNDGRICWIELRGRHFPNHGDTRGRIFGTISEVTERVAHDERLLALNNELEQARVRAETSDRAKSEFLAIMSHELRTPLNPIIGFAHLLQDQLNDPTQRDFLNNIILSSEKLLDLIDDLLTYAKLDKGTLIPQESAFRLMDQCREALAEANNSSGLAIQYCGPELSLNEVPENITVNGDEKLLRAVLRQIIGNAQKFCRQGSIKLHVSTLHSSLSTLPQDQQIFQFAVIDTGPGIPEDENETLFAPFRQLDNSTTRAFSGIGLGLATCRKIVNLLGGTIGLENATGHQGARAWFQIPFPVLPCQSHLPTDNQLSQALNTPRFSRPQRILIVEDNAPNALIAQTVIEDAGGSVTLAPDGHAAIERCHEQRFDLILLDLSMPGIDGVQTAHAIRNLSTLNAQTPLAVISAHPQSEQQNYCAKAGLVAYFEKPIRPILFINQIYALLEIKNPRE